jgi:hypothetical protein
MAYESTECVWRGGIDGDDRAYGVEDCSRVDVGHDADASLLEAYLCQ